MANILTDVVPILVAQGLQTLRAACTMPRLVNTDYSNEPADQGDTVNVWIPSAQAVSDVAPSSTPFSAPDSQPVKAPIPLNKWRRSGFYLTDKQQEEVATVSGFKSGQTAEAVKALAEDINAFIFQQYKKVYGFAGTPGTTPFATANSLADATSVRAVLNRQRAPLNPRRLVLDVNAEANALNQAPITTFQNIGSAGVITEGQIGRKLGSDWYMDQQVPTHTSTPLTAGAATANGAQAIGAGSTDGGRTGTVSIAKATNTSPLVAGDILSFAGDSQTYVVLADVTLAVGNIPL